MTEGSIPGKMLRFAFPVFIGNLFQQLYNTADALIVGNFIGSKALAAVTGAGNLVFLITGFFIGLSMGASVVISTYIGARDKGNIKKAPLIMKRTLCLPRPASMAWISYRTM